MMKNKHSSHEIEIISKDQEECGISLNQYQRMALETAIYPDDYKVVYPALGLAGEAGEVADKIKKVIRDKGGYFSPADCEEIALEIGDVLWYCAVLADRLGYRLDTIGRMNYRKLRSRQQRGMLGGSGDNR